MNAAANRPPRVVALLLVAGSLLCGAPTGGATTAPIDPPHRRGAAAGVLAKAFASPQRIVNPRWFADDQHGAAVAISGTLALVGAPALDGSGTVYAFERVDGVWMFRQQLRPPRATPEGGFGASLAMAGTRALVGVPGGDTDVARQGYAMVYAYANGRWEAEAELSIPDGASGDEFGFAVALSDTTAVVGARQADHGLLLDTGAAYVFVATAAGWTEQARLFAADATPQDRFGAAVAVSGDTALVGAPRDEVATRPAQGSAYAFLRSGASWTQQARLLAFDGASGDQFGTAVALDGNTAVVGAPFDDVGAFADQGSGYVLLRTGSAWSLQQKLVNADGQPTDRTSEAAGFTVALQGDTALLGALGVDAADQANAGAVVSFTRSGTLWTRRDLLENQQAGAERLGFALALSGDLALATTFSFDTPFRPDSHVVQAWQRSGLSWGAADIFRGSDAARDAFGYSVAQFGDHVLVGAFGVARDGVDNVGAAYLFRHAAGDWLLEAELQPSDAPASGAFGLAVALDATHAYVSAPFAAAGDVPVAGAVYVFERSPGWPERAKLQLLDAGSDALGYSLALAGDTLFAGAPTDVVGGVARGSVATWQRDGNSWTEGSKVFASDGVANDGFGYAVAARADLLLVGAPALGFDAARSGSAHLFERSGAGWRRLQRFDLADPVDSNYFGAAVALAPDEVFVGAPLQEVAMLPARGAAFVARRSAQGWSAPLELPNSASEDSATVGTSLAWADGILLVGAAGLVAANDSRGESSLYRYERSGDAYVERARLRPPGHPSGSGYGAAVAWDGRTAVIGEPVHSPYFGTPDVGAVHLVEELGVQVFADGFEAP